MPLLSGGRILAAVSLAYKNYQRLAEPKDTSAQSRASGEMAEICYSLCNHLRFSMVRAVWTVG